MQAPTYPELMEAQRAYANDELRLEGIEADAWANRAATAALVKIANEIGQEQAA